jgi:hypothetical protein
VVIHLIFASDHLSGAISPGPLTSPTPPRVFVCVEWHSGSAVLGMIFKEGNRDLNISR